jgi:predicted MPP superfamily phosphohydrolase
LRRGAVAAGAAAAGLVAWGAWIEPRRTVVRRRALRLPHWPRELDGLRLALVSDLHAGAPHIGLRRIAHLTALVQQQHADLVCLLGDFVDPEVTFARPLAPELVARPLGALHAPLGVIAVLGNHDWRTDGPRVTAALRTAGATVLENEAVRVHAGDRSLWVAGLEDPTERVPDIGAALDSVPAGEPLLVLSHDPDVFPGIPSRAALTLAGHTHGGQVNLGAPLRARVIPSLFGDRYGRGHVVEDGRHLYVTSGVGTSNHPVRFARPPEIVVLTLRGRGSDA